MDNIKGLNRNNYVDRVDVDFDISLYEYGLVRNPKTNHVIFCINYYDVEEYGMTWKNGLPVPMYQDTYITWSNVWDALEEASNGYYNFIGSDKETEQVNLEKNYLTRHILSLNMYNGWFSPTKY